MDKLAIVSTMLPRLELDFIDEWAKYHSCIVDEINIYYDPRDIKIWSKKPFGDYHLDKDNDSIIDEFKSICNKYPKINLYKSEGQFKQIIGYQLSNLDTSISKTNADFIFHIDCDEFIKIDDYSIFNEDHIGIQQQIMDLRWKNHHSIPNVRDIILGKNVVNKYSGAFGSKIWKTCWFKPKFTYQKTISLIHHGGLVSNIPSRKQIQIFHYVGWHYRQDETHWKSFESIKTTEFQKHFEKVLLSNLKVF